MRFRAKPIGWAPNIARGSGARSTVLQTVRPAAILAAVAGGHLSFLQRDRQALGFRPAGISVPQGRVKIAQCFSTGLVGRCGESRRGRQRSSPTVLSSPSGLASLRMANPALKCWAIFVCPCGTDGEMQDSVQETEMRPAGRAVIDMSRDGRGCGIILWLNR